MSWTKNSFFSQSRPDSYSDDDCWASLITSNQFLLGFFQVFELLHVVSVLEHHSSSSRHIFPTQKKKLSENQFFFLILLLFYLFLKSAATGRTRIRTLCAVERKSEVNRTELESHDMFRNHNLFSFISHKSGNIRFDWFHLIFYYISKFCYIYTSTHPAAIK